MVSLNSNNKYAIIHMLTGAKQHIIPMGVSTLLAGFSLGCLIFFTDPYTAGWITHVFFYFSLFLTTLGVVTILGITTREIFFKGLYIVNLSISFRQALLVSSFLTASLLLQSGRLLFWWVELIIILLVTFIEIFLSLKV